MLIINQLFSSERPSSFRGSIYCTMAAVILCDTSSRNREIITLANFACSTVYNILERLNTCLR